MSTLLSKHSKWVLPTLFIVCFFTIWQLLAEFGLINRVLLSSPSDMVEKMMRIFKKTAPSQANLPTSSLLVAHILATLKRLLIAAAIGTFLGCAVGIAMGLSQRIFRFLDPLITVIMPIPGIAIAPLFIVWLGFGDATINAVGAIATFFPVAYNAAAGVRTVDDQLVRAARIMGASKLSTLWSVYLPWASSHILLGVKLGLARCWRTVIAVELIASTNIGLGFMIMDATEYLNSSVVYGGIIIMIALYYLLEKGVLDVIERNTLVKWGMLNEQT